MEGVDVKFRGKCLDMCPRTEIIMREKEHLLHKYEVSHRSTKATERVKADYAKCVKKYSRPAAGQPSPDSKDIRPPEILKKTVNYLISKILTLENEDWGLQYEFVFDRLRAVRQDIVIQNVWNPEITFIYECIVRFHIYSIYKLCERSISVFDPHINGTHLQECLKRLIIFYLKSSYSSPNQCEMEAYYLLYNLGSNDAIQHALLLPESVRLNPLVKLSMDINFAHINSNYVRLFRKISELPFLGCVAVMHHIRQLQRNALNMMNIGYSAKNSKFPVSLVKELLLYDSETDVLAACHHYGITVENDMIHFYKPHFHIYNNIEDIKRFKFIQEKHKNVTLPNIFYKSEYC